MLLSTEEKSIYLWVDSSMVINKSAPSSNALSIANRIHIYWFLSSLFHITLLYRPQALRAIFNRILPITCECIYIIYVLAAAAAYIRVSPYSVTITMARKLIHTSIISSPARKKIRVKERAGEWENLSSAHTIHEMTQQNEGRLRLHRPNKIQWKFNSSTIKHHYLWLAQHMPYDARELSHGVPVYVFACLRSILNVLSTLWVVYVSSGTTWTPQRTVTMWQKTHTIYLSSHCTSATHTRHHTCIVFPAMSAATVVADTRLRMFTFRTVTVMRWWRAQFINTNLVDYHQ